jgi:hypothetical protein
MGNQPHEKAPLMKLCVIVAALACVLSASAAASGNLSPDMLLQRIRQQGGQIVLAELWQDRQAFDGILKRIAKGEPQWLEVARRLRPFSDAGASESIDEAVARALPVQPRRVLSLVGQGFELEHLCTSPFIEPKPDVAKAYERETLTALAKVSEPGLAGLATECAKRVRLPEE